MRWFLAAVLILLAALVLESGLLAYAMYVLLGLLLLTRWLARSWAENLSATRTCRRARRGPDDSEEAGGGLAVEIGERVVVRVTVHNGGALPVPWVILEDALPGALNPRFPKLKVKGKRVQLAMVRAGA